MPDTLFVDLRASTNLSQLSTSLGIDADILLQLAGVDSEQFYRRHAIPKRSARRHGEAREVYEAGTEELSYVHRTLHRILLTFVQHQDATYPLPCCFGFVRKRSTRDNATEHCGQPLVRRIDIENFFPSITKAKVEQLFIGLGMQALCADVLSRILCFKGYLVPGLSASPLVANLIARGLDERLTALARAVGAKYTRYADDIAFSGQAVPVLRDIEREVEAEGFRVSQQKRRLTKPGQAHFVTGLSVQDPTRPHVPKVMKRRLRQELYYARKYSIAEHLARLSQKVSEGVNRIDGSVRYVSYIEHGTKYDFTDEWEQILVRDDLRPDVPSNRSKDTAPCFVAVDETLFELNGQRFVALAFVLYNDPDAVEEPLRKLLSDYSANPYEAGRKDAIEEKGLHFTDAHPSLQRDIAKQLPKLPMRVLVGITRVPSTQSMELNAAYLRVFRWGWAMLCRRCDRKQLTFYVEQGPAVDAATLSGLITQQYSVYEKLGQARPAELPALHIVDKSFLPIALPDCMLGILGGYVKTAHKNNPAQGLWFEQVRDRFSLIVDIDRTAYHSRNRPFRVDSLA